MRIRHSLVNNVEVASEKVVEVKSPYDGSVIGKVSLANHEIMEQAVSAAVQAYQKWRRSSFQERKEYLRALSDNILKRADEIVELIAREQGKPVSEVYSVDIVPVLDNIKFLIKKGEMLLKPERVTSQQILLSHKKGYIRFDPLGVIGIITPWNFPFSIPFIQIVYALFCGNTVVVKPSSASMLTQSLIGELVKDSGFPPGVVNIITLPGRETDALVEHPALSRIIFTGSVDIGKRVMQKASKNLTPITLELGGKDPAIVCSDTDLVRTVEGITWGAFLNAGQVCASVERVYVEEAISDVFIEKLVERVKEIKLGDPLDPETDIGPMTISAQIEIIERQIEDATKKGAVIKAGGKRGDGNFFPPTVITNVNHEMLIMKEESFGPVLPVMVVKDLDEAISLANDTSFGLTASGWTQDPEKARRIQEEVIAGTVTINDCIASFSEPAVIWGGLKESGFGRTHSKFGLHELVNIKHVSFDNYKKPMVWWFPYDKDYSHFNQVALKLLYKRRLLGRLPYLVKIMFIPRFWQRVEFGKLLKRIYKLF